LVDLVGRTDNFPVQGIVLCFRVRLRGDGIVLQCNAVVYLLLVVVVVSLILIIVIVIINVFQSE